VFCTKNYQNSLTKN